jgi:hypothetical protein
MFCNTDLSEEFTASGFRFNVHLFEQIATKPLYLCRHACVFGCVCMYMCMYVCRPMYVGRNLIMFTYLYLLIFCMFVFIGELRN